MSVSILYVCTGNTCRSPAASALTSFHIELADPAISFPLTVSSAGLHVKSPTGPSPSMDAALSEFLQSSHSLPHQPGGADREAARTKVLASYRQGVARQLDSDVIRTALAAGTDLTLIVLFNPDAVDTCLMKVNAYLAQEAPGTTLTSAQVTEGAAVCGTTLRVVAWDVADPFGGNHETQMVTLEQMRGQVSELLDELVLDRMFGA
jgi:protein-tyrosine-phosphatase